MGEYEVQKGIVNKTLRTRSKAVMVDKFCNIENSLKAHCGNLALNSLPTYFVYFIEVKKPSSNRNGKDYKTLFIKIPECQTIIIQATTSQITITGLAGGFFLQNITYINGSMIRASDGSWNNTSLMSFVPGKQYVIYYGNDSISCCRNVTTIPDISSLAVNNYESVDVLGATWIKPAENTSYLIILSGAMYSVKETNNTQVNFTGLLPGREYFITVETFSRACGHTSPRGQGATYPAPPRNLTFNTIGINILSLSWMEPVNMAGVTKSYNISYGMSPSTTLSVTSTTTNVTLQSLISGTNYSISVVTVGVRGYQSSPVTTSVYTIIPECQTIVIQATTSQITITGLAGGFFLQNVTYINGSMIQASDGSWNNTSLMSFVSGTQYVIYYGNDSISCCRNVTTIPDISSLAVNNYESVDVLGATWIKPAENMFYVIILSGAMYIIKETNNTQVNFTGLLPGREYFITVESFSKACGHASPRGQGATYPAPPRNLTFNTIGINILSLSWMEPVNMAGVTKSYNISYGMSPSTTLSVTSPTTNVTLQSLISGTNYSISVVTVGVRGYQSSPVTTSVYTKPMPVKFLQIGIVISDFVSLTWSKPDEYQTSYSYRIQTLNSSSTMINDTIVTSESATIMNLTPGETYTFIVYTRAADNSTESDPVSLSLPTCPGDTDITSLAVNNYESVDVLGATWIKPAENVTYVLSLRGAVNITLLSDDTQVNLTGLLPGREYKVTVGIFATACGRNSATATEATYPTPPRNLTFTTIGMNILSLSWMEPINMTDVMKTYNISYENSLGTWTVTSPTTIVTLQNLTSGTNYSITVATVGIRQYLSSPVSGSAYTSLPDQAKNITINISISNGSIDIILPPFDSSNGPIVAYAVILTTEMNAERPPRGILSKTYDHFKNKLTDTYVTYITEQNVTLRSARTYEIGAHVGDGTKFHSYINGPLNPQLQYRVSIAGFKVIQYEPNTDTINEDQSVVSFTRYTSAFALPAIATTTTITPNTITTKTTVGPGQSYTGAIVGAVIGSLFGIFALIGGFLMWRKCKRRKCESDRQRNRIPSSLRNEGGDTVRDHAIVTDSRGNVGEQERRWSTKSENFEALFKKLQANNELGFVIDYDRLQSVGILQQRSVAVHTANEEKNRADATYPYDKSRVKLSTLENSSDGYINASYIPGYTSKKEFIAAQHPLPGTMKDFWYMIWENRITTIVMLSSRREDYQGHGEEYWPKTEAKTFGNILSTFISENIHNGWTIRDFMVTNLRNNKSHQVRQFHLTEWPEDCNIDNREILIQFVREVRQYKEENSSNCPILVHCRTGSGRSGIFIALVSIINQLEVDKKVDVYGTVQKMHLHRPLMVQTVAQYIFLHRCALDIVRGENNVNTRGQNMTLEQSEDFTPNTRSLQTRNEPIYEHPIPLRIAARRVT
ncbi:receptor-type tyrosine-protein phosphatase eta-like [Anomaloglossus baeobatrachus]|uniref:receptor-type tyrosine-protein phosphatase eta-like n=1 Tax=Anomaloglossus baeobatrachus TaxID=238106 RepID=UPI003F4F6A62